MDTETEGLQQALESDAARLVRLIAHLAPTAGLQSADTARLDQLAAAARTPRG